jgi:putative heme-binding domain-containing protein
VPRTFLFIFIGLLPAFAGESGYVVYGHRCAACHGQYGQGGRGPDLTRALTADRQDEDLFRVISGGVPGTEMRGYGAQLAPEEIRRIIAYLRSITRDDSKSNGNPVRGESLFWGSGGCGNCHAVGERGSLLGPDLTRIGKRRGLEYLRASLLTPDQEITSGYDSVTVITRDGKTLKGIQRALDEFSVQFIDLQGKYYSLETSKVQSVKADRRSLMPAYGQVFDAGELDDLLAFLLSLHGEVK